jgi:hypothetical protein
VIHPFVKEVAIHLAIFGDIRLKGRILEVFTESVGWPSLTSHYISFGPGQGWQKEIMRQGYLLLSGPSPVGTLMKGESNRFF